MTDTAALTTAGSPFIRIERREWSALAPERAFILTEAELSRLRGLGDFLDLDEVTEVMLPLTRLINLYAASVRQLASDTADFLRRPSLRNTPFVIGVAGSVAVGKSTISRVLRELLSRWEGTPRVERVTTDGFLLPNAELERRGLLQRKGFPESYDRRALVRFVAAVKAGAAEVRAPFYSHLDYDIVAGAEIVVRQPDVLIVEGLNVLQPPRGNGLALSDLFDFSVYVDAKSEHIEGWYVDRFLALQRGAFADPKSYFHKYASLSEHEARAEALRIWRNINEPNLVENVRPTRQRADLVLRKGGDHTVRHVLLRKL